MSLSLSLSLLLCFFSPSYLSSLSPDMEPINPLDHNHFHLDEHHLWLDQKTLFLSSENSPDQSCDSAAIQPILMVLPCVCICVRVCVCVCVYACACVSPPSPPHPPVFPLPGLWKANEESWAEGSFCMLVKKNNLCQRKVLQQLCCRTCSQKGWRDTLTGRKGSAGGRDAGGHRGQPSFSKSPPPAHTITVT